MAVKQTPAEAIVTFLSFSGAANNSVSALEKFAPRQWGRVQLWLDDGGLAFYFLQRLKDTNTAAVVPPAVLSRLERNFASNRARVDGMSVRFNEINKQFDDLGLQYQAVKGFSLIPEFSADASLRYQADFDYLVAEESLPAARRVLLDMGYAFGDRRSEKEFIFVTPEAKPLRGDAQYLPQAPHAVELHTELWDNGMHDLQPIPRLFTVDEAPLRHWNGLSFPAQTDEDAFLLQVLHACRHLFTQWIRVSNLFEIGYFLSRRWSDPNLWNRVAERVGENAIVREFVVIIAELANRLFAAPIPCLLQDWRTNARRQSHLWIEHYGRSWALGELPAYEFSLFPQSKLVLFLQQQYRSSGAYAQARKNDRAAASRQSRIISSLRAKPWLLLNREWRQKNRIIGRSVFYALAAARYICEIPRWHWLNRSSASSASGRHLLPSKNNP